MVPPSRVSATLIGVPRMLLILLLPIDVLFPFMNLVLFVVIFYFWGVVLSFGKLIRKLASVVVPVRPKLRPLMNV
jgi:hypothetical protein